MELSSPTKVKLKRRLPGIRNKKQPISPIDLEESTCQTLSRFEYEAKRKRTSKESQNNIHAKKRKLED